MFVVIVLAVIIVLNCLNKTIKNVHVLHEIILSSVGRQSVSRCTKTISDKNCLYMPAFVYYLIIAFYFKRKNSYTLYMHTKIFTNVCLYVCMLWLYVHAELSFENMKLKFFFINPHLVCTRDQQWIVFSLLISTHEILNINDSTIMKFNS